MNCGDLIACARVMSGCGTASTGAPAPPASAGGRRTRSDTGIMMAATTTARICIVVRQSWLETSQATIGDINLAEQDALALRVKIRLGFTIVAPMGLGVAANAFPFANLTPKAGP